MIQDFFKATLDPRHDINQATPPPTIGGFGSNIANGIGQLAQGFANIPKDIYTGITQPQTVAPAVSNAIKGIGSSFNNMAGQPIGSQGQLQMPSVAEATQDIYNHPVDVATNLLALGKLAKIGEAGKVAEATKPIVSATKASPLPDIADPADVTTPLKKATKVPDAMISRVQAPKDAVANYNTLFQVPRNVVQNMHIKPEQVINQLIHDGVTGVGSLDELKNVVDNTTGDNGAFPRINRIILGDNKQPLDYSVAKEAVAPAIKQYLEGSPQGLVNTVENQITRAMPKDDYTNPDTSERLPLAQGESLFDSTQELGKLQAMYQRKAYTVMGDLTNPEYERAAQAIGEVKHNIEDVLDDSNSGESYQKYKSDPRVLDQLNRLPGGVQGPMAQRWLQSANRFKQGRTIQAPYVALDSMITHTKDAQLAAFTKWTNKMQEQQPSVSASQAITHPIETAQSMIQPGIQKILSPMLDKTPEDVIRQKTSGRSGNLPPLSNGVAGKVRGAMSGGLSTLPAIMGANQMTNNTQNQNNTPIPNSNSPQDSNHTNILPPNGKSGIQSQAGRYGLTPPQSAGLLTTNDYTTQQNTLTQKIAQDKASGNTVEAEQDQGTLDQLNNSFTNQKPIRESFTTTNNVMGLGNAAYSLIKEAPVSLFNLNGSFDSLLNATDPKYATLGKALQSIQNTTGINLSSAKSKEALVASLDYAISTSQNAFNAQIQQYFGGNTLNAGAPSDTNLPQIQAIQPSPSQTPPPSVQIGGGNLPSFTQQFGNQPNPGM